MADPRADILAYQNALRRVHDSVRLPSMSALRIEVGRFRRASGRRPAPTQEEVLRHHAGVLIWRWQLAIQASVPQIAARARASVRALAAQYGAQNLHLLDAAFMRSAVHESDAAGIARRAGLMRAVHARMMQAARRAVEALPADAPRATIASAMAEAVRSNFWQVQRIAVTEAAFTYNEARKHALRQIHALDSRVMMRWTEHVDDATGQPLDERVAVDSVLMHGQVAMPGEAFTMPPGSRMRAGQAWAHPPNRPNDRAVLQPWLAGQGVPGWHYQGGVRIDFPAQMRR
jgi:hypothetical protein